MTQNILPWELQLGEAELKNLLGGDALDLLTLEGGDAVLEDSSPEWEEVRGAHDQPVHPVVRVAGLRLRTRAQHLRAGRHPLPPDGQRHRAQVLVDTEPVLVIWKVENSQ